MNEDPTRIQAILQAETQCLEAYLLGPDVYRQIRVEDRNHVILHLMSLGDYLELRAIARTLAADDPTAPGETLLRTFSRQADALAARELQARLQSLQWSMEEWSKEGHLNARYFAAEMVQRSRIQRLGAAHDWFRIAQDLEALDARIQGVTVPGPFIWRQDYVKAFPEDQFWFLYRTLRAGAEMP